MDLVASVQSDLHHVEIFLIGVFAHQTVTLVIEEWRRIAVE
jgi:hypothetical protein